MGYVAIHAQHLGLPAPVPARSTHQSDRRRYNPSKSAAAPLDAASSHRRLSIVVDQEDASREQRRVVLVADHQIPHGHKVATVRR